jgi:hypothetical protein
VHSVRVKGGALSNLETLWRVTTYVPEEGENLVYRALKRVKTCSVSALHYVYNFVRAGGGCDGIYTLYTEMYTMSAFLYRYRNHPVPVRLCGFTLRVTAEQAEPIRQLDPFFLQGTASASNVFMYMSCKYAVAPSPLYHGCHFSLTSLPTVLKAPQTAESIDNSYVYQICISWNMTQDPADFKQQAEGPTTHDQRISIIKTISESWAEPFKTFVQHISDNTLVPQLDLDDFVPTHVLSPQGRVLFVGDASHAMVMCKCRQSLRIRPYQLQVKLG